MLRLYSKAKALYATRDRGASAAEYALLVAFIAAVLVTTIVLFQSAIVGALDRTCDALNGSGGATC